MNYAAKSHCNMSPQRGLSHFVLAPTGLTSGSPKTALILVVLHSTSIKFYSLSGHPTKLHNLQAFYGKLAWISPTSSSSTPAKASELLPVEKSRNMIYN